MIEEIKDWWADVKLAFEIYRAIRRMLYMQIDRDKNRFELRWYSGRRKSTLQRVAEHKEKSIGLDMTQGYWVKPGPPPDDART